MLFESIPKGYFHRMTQALLKTFGDETALFTDSDAHFDHAVNALSCGNYAVALTKFSQAFDAHAQQSIVTRVFNEAGRVRDLLLKSDYLLFVARHTTQPTQKAVALEGTITTLLAAANGNADAAVDNEAIAHRTLDVFGYLPNDLNGILQRGRALELWHKQMTAMLQRDELAGTHRIKSFLGNQAVKRAVTGLDEVTAGVLNGAITRVLAEQKHAAIPSRLTMQKLLAAHATPTASNGKPYLN